MSTEPRCVPAPKDPYFRDAEQFFAVDKYMFSRRGCWLALSIAAAR